MKNDITMETPEVKKQKLISQLVAAANKITGENRIGKADHVIIPDKNIESIAKKFNITVKEAQELLKEYFAPKSTQNEKNT